MDKLTVEQTQAIQAAKPFGGYANSGHTHVIDSLVGLGMVEVYSVCTLPDSGVYYGLSHLGHNMDLPLNV